MIQKRYQYNSRKGIIYSSWFDYSDDDSQIEELIKNEAKQLGKLKNEYRIV
jgi:hypothetical protein